MDINPGSVDRLKHPELVLCPVDITRSRWDQHTFVGRLNHFAQITNPLLLLRSRKDLDSAQQLYRLAKYVTIILPLTQTCSIEREKRTINQL